MTTVAGIGPTISPIPLPAGLRGQAAKPEVSANQSEQKKVKPQVIHSTAADLQRIGLVFNKKLQFVVDHNSKEVIVKVIDKETDKVVKELPPEELQRLHHNLKETIGFLFDERV